ncbi:MAG: hypothetical protein WA970_26215 [Gammaproteobacteria bacterium]|jgi:hypothetical protein
MNSKKQRFLAVSLLVPFAVAGCGLEYTDVRVPRAYRSATPRDMQSHAPDRTVTGRGCQYGLSLPIRGSSSLTRVSGGAGHGGFQQALSDIRARHSQLRGIYDLKVDHHLFSVLMVFRPPLY